MPPKDKNLHPWHPREVPGRFPQESGTLPGYVPCLQLACRAARGSVNMQVPFYDLQVNRCGSNKK